MPDTLNKQAIINLLIDSPLREPIKINLIDIFNNTSEADLPKVFSTITKELEIFQKATERRMKLADETIAKLGGTTVPTADSIAPAPSTATPSPITPAPSLPPLNLPPLPQPPATEATPTQQAEPTPLTVPPLDLPPMPTAPVNPSAVEESPVQVAPAPTFQPLGSAPMNSTSDEDALAEIQKELDSLKSEAAADITSAATPATPSTAPQA